MMAKLRKIKATLLLTALTNLMIAPVWAQNEKFKFKADLLKLDSTGIYRIELSPDIIAKSKTGLADLRLIDEKGKNVAYALSRNLTFNKLNELIAFPLVPLKDANDSAYVFENKNNLDVSKLWLKLKNTEVERTVNLSGGDDLKQWFAIKEDIVLEQAGEGIHTDYLQSLTFPASNYRYFKIEIKGKNKLPVKILQAGIYTASLNTPVYATLPPIKLIARDSDKKTNILFNLNQPYLINKLHLIIAGPKFYNRRVIIYAAEKSSGGAYEAIADTNLRSSGSQDILLSAKTKHITIVIVNGDDNALDITAINAYQLKQYAIAYLEKAHKYSLLTGYPFAHAGEYDLSFLNNLSYNQLAGITHSAVYVNPEFAIVQPNIVPDHSVLLWVTIILVLLLLSFFTMKMVREIK